MQYYYPKYNLIMTIKLPVLRVSILTPRVLFKAMDDPAHRKMTKGVPCVSKNGKGPEQESVCDELGMIMC